MTLSKLGFYFVAGALLFCLQVTVVRGESPSLPTLSTTASVPTLNSSSTFNEANLAIPASNGAVTGTNSVRHDLNQIHHDRENIRHDRENISQNRQDIRAAEHDIQINPQNKSADQARISNDQKSIHNDQRDLAKSRQQIHHAQLNLQAIRAQHVHQLQQGSGGNAVNTGLRGGFAHSHTVQHASQAEHHHAGHHGR